MGNSDSLADPVKLRFLYPPVAALAASTRVSRVHSRIASPACHPCYPGSPSIGSGSYRQDRCSGLPPCRTGSTTPLCFSRLHLGSLTLRPAGLLDSPKEPLSENLVLQVTLFTSLKLRGRTTELPRSDFSRQVIRFTRHTLLTNGEPVLTKLQINKSKVYGCDEYSKENDQKTK